MNKKQRLLFIFVLIFGSSFLPQFSIAEQESIPRFMLNSRVSVYAQQNNTPNYFL